VLKAQDQFEAERMRYPPQRFDANRVSAALDALDLDQARTRTIGKLLPAQAMIHAIANQQPGDLSRSGARLTLLSINGATRDPAAPSDVSRRADWLQSVNGGVLNHARTLPPSAEGWTIGEQRAVAF
jgi:hypothetical protein